MKAAGGRWVTVVGVEVHARIACASKLFSGAASVGASRYLAPNSRVSLFDAAHPGTLPSLNEACVDQAVRTAIALNCSVNEQSIFERKHYFYCDLPHGYQITQHRLPIASSGFVDLDALPRALGEHGTSGEHRRMRVSRIQVEQDSGKTLHEGDESLVDLNRAGWGSWRSCLSLICAPRGSS